MTALTHQKYEAKTEIYNLLEQHLNTLSEEELRKWALRLASLHMQKMQLKELQSWLAKLKKEQT